jgi:hypothetical protein
VAYTFPLLHRQSYRVTTSWQEFSYSKITRYVDDYSGFNLSKKEAAGLEESMPVKKPRKMRFYVDEDVPSLAVQILRVRGFNVQTVQEEK